MHDRAVVGCDPGGVPAPADAERRGDEIRLTLPARADHGRIARVMVSRLGVRHGFRPREVEDLRIATDEAIILVLAGDGAAEGSLTVRARLDGPTLVVDVAASHTEELDETAVARFEQLVGDLVDEVEVDGELGTVRFRRRRA